MALSFTVGRKQGRRVTGWLPLCKEGGAGWEEQALDPTSV